MTKRCNCGSPPTAKTVKSIVAHDGAVVALGLNADGTKAVTTGADKTLKVWNLVAAPALIEEKPSAITLPRRRPR